MLLFQRSPHRRLERSLRERVRFLGLLVELSSSHRHSPGNIDHWLEDWLRRLGEFLGLDRAVLVEEHRGEFLVTHAWSADPEFAPGPAKGGDFPWSTDQIRRGNTVRAGRLSEMPPEAAADREALHKAGVRSLLATPLLDGDRAMGALVLTTRRAERAWPSEMVTDLRLVGDILASALVARRAEMAQAASEKLSETLLGVVSGPTAVLDDQGHIVNANEAWVRLGREPGQQGVPWAPVGSNYLEACDLAAATAGSPVNGETLASIRSVLGGARKDYRLKYECPSCHLGEMIVAPLSPPEGGAVVSYIDSTDLERAERDAQELRQTIAHFGRVATLGELSASLAHELNQPLTAILSNVQAARRFLAAEPQNLGEIREILTDIEADDRRAGEVIRRLRALMRKETAEWETLHLHQLAREVLGLLSSDSRTRQVSIGLELDETLPPVRADRVQLSQVILNLLLNGTDAMEGTVPAERMLRVRTWRYDDRSVALSVRDRGSGIRADPIERVFQPFYTTKPEGLGIGLCICQTILQTHGGRIWATNNPDRGATFHIVLPASRSEAGR